MEGAFYWKYYWGAQLGNEGFFGTYDRTDLGTLGAGPMGNLTNANFWAGRNDLGSLGVQGASFGVAGQTDLKTGHDASLQTMWMDIDPEIRMNQAVRLRGRYHVGEWGTQARDENPNSQNAGMQNAFSEGKWRLLWLTAQTPWGIIAAGKRPFAFGLGTIFDGTYETTTDSLLLVVPYGPLRIGLATYPWRSGQAYIGDLADKSGCRVTDDAVFVTYTAGAVDIGLFGSYNIIHAGAEAATTGYPAAPTGVANLATRRATFGLDAASWFGCYYLKYNNGRFFFNAEASNYVANFRFLNSMNTVGGALTLNPGGFGSVIAPRYLEDWRYAIILGTVAGPVKVSGFWLNSTGFDRRAGLYIDRQGILTTTTAAGAANGGLPVLHNTVLVLPYSWLLAHQYGGGNNAFGTASADGGLYDVNAFAARVDYAIAANLNTWVSFIWADRYSKSYPWGFITVTANYNTNYNYSPGGLFGPNGAPSIPDQNLGWEVDLGLDWRLLEGFRVEALAAYWQPGKWFNYACVDLGVANWNVPTAANTWGVNPSRTIDPVVGGYVALVGEF
jgi:hypothetical protein